LKGLLMPIFSPGRRFQLPYLPTRIPDKGKSMAALERMIKGPLWGCRMCGNCLLQETAFICPMACPKGLRNGPCGGSTSDSCYLDPTYPCIWYQIFDRAKRMEREDLLMEVLPPLDWDNVGKETWGEVLRQVKQVGTKTFVASLFKKNEEESKQVWDSVFKTIRQPGWWQGDDLYHPPGYEEPISEFERQLKSGKFVVAAEISPPASTATGKLLRDIEMVAPYTTAINFTDAASATPRMSSLACGEFAIEAGAEPVLQIAARDQTRTGLQGHIIGASARGIRNVLVVSGDSPILGPKPMARTDILDIDSVQMLWILRRMRVEGIYLGGRSIKYPPKIFLGAAASPFASNPRIQAIREHKKVNAGAQFFQTNLVFDPDGLDMWLNELAKRNILDKVYILIGITPLRSLKIAKYMHDQVPGVRIPDRLMKRLEAAGDGVEEEAVTISLEIIEEVRKKEGVNGIHLMPVGWEKIVPRIVEEIDPQYSF
jgi:methylenetetrahydrofolate reductase (NADPH)